MNDMQLLLLAAKTLISYQDEFEEYSPSESLYLVGAPVALARGANLVLVLATPQTEPDPDYVGWRSGHGAVMHMFDRAIELAGEMR